MTMLRSVHAGSRALAGLAVATAATAQTFVMTTDAAGHAMASFSVVDGSLLAATVFALPNTAQPAAIDVNGEIWISEQTGDRIRRCDANGVVLATIDPTFPGGGLDDVRGMAFVNGLVYVTNAGTANGAPGNAIEAFDPLGAFQFAFSTQGLATSPTALVMLQGQLLVAGAANADDVHRFSLSGADLGTFHDSALLDGVQQLAAAADGSIWCAAANGVVARLDKSTGAVLASFAAPGARGVFELDDGNVLWSNGSGVWVHDLVAATSTLVFVGDCAQLARYGAGTPANTLAYGSGCDGVGLNAYGVPELGNLGFELNVTNVPPVSPLGFLAFGTLQFSPGVDLTSLGMPGCYAHTNADLGLFAAGPAVGGFSVLPMPIPNQPTLTGVELFSQGVTLSAATPFGLATSNGLLLVLGI